VGTLGLALLLSACGQRPMTEPESPVQRGEYLVNRVGMCIDCHSPWKDGHPDAERPMVGSRIPFAPLAEVPGWQPEAPSLAGLEERTHEEVVRVLTTGLKANGKPPRPPMPPYRMKDTDAQAVAAYLKTLKAK
jgi:mono/diheme cytochrome c family protein